MKVKFFCLFTNIALFYLDNPSYIKQITPNRASQKDKIILIVWSTLKTDKSQLLQVKLDNNYVCVLSNPKQTLEPNLINNIECQLPEMPVGYYKISLFITNGGGLIDLIDYSKYFHFKNVAQEFHVGIIPYIQSLKRQKGSFFGDRVEINGAGFSSNCSLNSVAVNGAKMNLVVCTETQLLIETFQDWGAKVSQDFNFGNYGAKLFIYQKVTNISDLTTIDLSLAKAIFHLLDFQIYKASGVKDTGSIIQAYFKAPLTSRYRFYCSSNGESMMRVSNVSFSNDRRFLQSACEVKNSTEENYFFKNETQISKWFSLVKDSFFMIEGLYVNKDGNEKLKIAVEIENKINDQVLPFARIHDVQEVKFYAEFLSEKLSLVIGPCNISKSSIVLMYKSLKYFGGVTEIKLGKLAIEKNFVDFFGVNLSLSYEFQDINRKLTENIYQAEYIFINMEFSDILRSNSDILPEINTTYLLSVNSTVKPIFEFTQLSKGSFPFTGNYSLTLLGNKVNNIYISISVANLTKLLKDNIPDISSQFTIYSVQNDKELKIYLFEFLGNNGKNPLIEIDTTNLTAGVNKKGFTANVRRILEGSNNFFLNPIPTELLFQVNAGTTLSLCSNSISSVCPNLNCSYDAYDKVITPEITKCSISNNQLQFTISNLSSLKTNGITFANPQTDIIIFFDSYLYCDNSTNIMTSLNANETSLLCTYDPNLLYSGNFLLKVFIKNFGFLRNTCPEADYSLKIPLSIGGMNPISGSINGGTEISFTGKNFPYQSSNEKMKILFGEKECIIIDIQLTSIRCLTPQLNETILSKSEESDSYEISIRASIEFNSISNREFSFLFQISKTPIVISISPLIVFPLDPNEITITFKNSYSNILQSEVYLVSDQARIPCNIQMSYVSDNSLKCITFQTLNQIKLGSFQFELRTSDGYARVIGANSFYFGGRINSVSPLEGSRKGGAQLQIEGEQLDKRYKITLKADDYAISCLTDEDKTNKTSLTCSLPFSNSHLAKDYIIFLGLGNSLIQSSLKFSLKDNITIKASLIDQSIKASFGDKITFSCSASKIGLEVWIAPVTNISNLIKTSIVTDENNVFVTVPNSLPGNYKILLNQVPLGYLDLNNDSVEIVTRCVQVIPSVGSVKGGIIEIVGSNFPDKPSILFNSKELKVIQFGLDSIKADFPEINADSSLILTLTVGSKNICNLKYSVALSSTPKLDIIITSSDTQFTVSITSSINIDDIVLADFTFINNQTFEKMFPASKNSISAAKFSLFYNKDSFSGGFYDPYFVINKFGSPIFSSSNIQIIVEPKVTSTIKPDSNSIAGGGELQIIGKNFYLDKSKISIQICGRECSLLSNSLELIKCDIPTFLTAQALLLDESVSKTQEDVTPMGKLMTDKNNINGDILRDNNVSTFYSSDSKDCFIAFDFGSDSYISLGEIGIAPNGDLNTYGDFQGSGFQYSDDGLTWKNIINVTNLNDNMTFYSLQTKVEGRFIRFSNQDSISNCRINEIKLFGIFISKSVSNECSIVLKFNNVVVQIPSDKSTIKYSVSTSPIVTSFTPIYSTFAGGGILKIQGKNLQNSNVFIGENSCAISSQTTTSISCIIPAKMVNSLARTNVILKNIVGNGWFSYDYKYFFYCEKWSDENTWDKMIPQKFSSVLIPQKKNILYDLSSFEMKLLIIEGNFFFASMDIEIKVEKLIIRGGSLFAGTSENPFTNQLKITMKEIINENTLINNELEDNVTRQYSAKTFVLFKGNLQLHGIPRIRWTELSKTAYKNDLSVELIKSVDWKVGDQILIGKSGQNDNYESNKIRLIADKIILFEQALLYDHICYVYEDVSLCPEIGILTSNIVFQGEPTQINSLKAGGILIIDGFGGVYENQECIENVRFLNVGQAYNLGAFPIFYRDVRTMFKSYFRSNAIENGFNRAIALQSSSNILISDNFIYKIYGNAISTMQGSEIYNKIYNNLIMKIGYSYYKIDYRDYDVAGIMLLNPENYLIGNHVSDSQDNGISFVFESSPKNFYSTSICPVGSRLLAFEDNYIHGIDNVGFNVDASYDSWKPRVKSCEKIEKTFPIVSIIRRIKVWNVGNYGISINYIGDNVRFEDLFIAQCEKAGMRINMITASQTLINKFKNMYEVIDTYFSLQNAKFIRDFAADSSLFKDSMGLMTPTTEGFIVQKLTFINYINTCIFFCLDCPDSDLGQTPRFKAITFINSIKRLMFHPKSMSGVLLDLDGSISENRNKISTNIFIVKYLPHLSNSCKWDKTLGEFLTCFSDDFSGILDCLFFEIAPSAEYNLVVEEVSKGFLNRSSSIVNLTEVSSIPFRKVEQVGTFHRFLLFSGKGWDLKFDTDKVAFSSLKLQCNLWRPGFNQIIIKLNFLQGINFELSMINKISQISVPIQKSTDYNQNLSGQECYINYDRQIIFLNIGALKMTDSNLSIKATFCTQNCQNSREKFTRLFSLASSWSSGKVPIISEEIEIPFVKRILLDIIPPFLSSITIDGELIFDEMLEESILEVNTIWVRKGRLIIGSQARAFPNKVDILLKGETASKMYSISGMSSNKMIIVSGEVNIYGVIRYITSTRLLKPLSKGSNIIEISEGVNWKLGEEILISSDYDPEQNEIFAIVGTSLGKITLNDTIKFDHFGSPTSEIFADKNFDRRCIISTFSRDIRVMGVIEKDVYWGGHIKVIKYVENNNIFYGKMFLSNVEMKKLGKSQFSALTSMASIIIEPGIDIVNHEKNDLKSRIYKCSLYFIISNAISIKSSQNVLIEENLIFKFAQYGIYSYQSWNLNIRDNLIINAYLNMTKLLSKVGYSAGIYLIPNDLKDKTENIISITSNIVSQFEVCYSIPGHYCNSKQISLERNIASSCDKGFVVFSMDSDCLEIKNITAYYTKEGLFTFFPIRKLIVNQLLFVENSVNLNLNKISSEDFTETSLFDSIFVGSLNHNYFESCSFVQLGVTLIYGKQYPIVKSLANVWDDVNHFTNFEDIVNITNNVFINFNQCYLFRTNPTASDYTSMHILSKNLLIGDKPSKISLFNRPKSEWKSSQFCGDEMLCTGLDNFLIKDLDGTIFSKNPSILGPLNSNLNKCNKNDDSYICDDMSYGILVLDILEPDKYAYGVSPVRINGSEFDFYNVLNSYMDHFYNYFTIYATRLNRFPSLIKSNKTYIVQFSNIFPSKFRVKLSGLYSYDSIKLKINLGNDFLKSIQIKNNSAIIAGSSEISDTFCGSNTFDMRSQYMILIINGSKYCDLSLSLINSIIFYINFNSSQIDKKVYIENLTEILAKNLLLKKDKMNIISWENLTFVLKVAGEEIDYDENNQNKIKESNQNLEIISDKFKKLCMEWNFISIFKINSVKSVHSFQNFDQYNKLFTNKNETFSIPTEPNIQPIANNTNNTNSTNNSAIIVKNTTNNNETTSNNTTNKNETQNNSNSSIPASNITNSTTNSSTNSTLKNDSKNNETTNNSKTTNDSNTQPQNNKTNNGTNMNSSSIVNKNSESENLKNILYIVVPITFVATILVVLVGCHLYKKWKIKRRKNLLHAKNKEIEF